MKWLLTFPEDRPAVPFYRGWLAAGGIASEVISLRDPEPADLAPFAALLLPGGGDVDPASYHADRHPRTAGVRREQDERELALIARFRGAGKPVFGICRGLQLLNVAMGGRLIQHLPDMEAGRVERHRRLRTYETWHPLICDESTRLGCALHEAKETNSAHHQAIDPEALGSGLRVAARSGAGVVEAVENAPGQPAVSAVQWHPERLPAEHPAARALMAYWRQLI